MPIKGKEARRRYLSGYHKAWYRVPENAARKKATAARIRKEQIQRNRQLLLEVKSEGGCCLCDEREPCCLEFHHRDQNKEFNVSDMIKQAYSLRGIKAEICKCCMLCRNCHATLHAGRLQLPGD